MSMNAKKVPSHRSSGQTSMGPYSSLNTACLKYTHPTKTRWQVATIGVKKNFKSRTTSQNFTSWGTKPSSLEMYMLVTTARTASTIANPCKTIQSFTAYQKSSKIFALSWRLTALARRTRSRSWTSSQL